MSRKISNYPPLGALSAGTVQRPSPPVRGAGLWTVRLKKRDLQRGLQLDPAIGGKRQLHAVPSIVPLEGGPLAVVAQGQIHVLPPALDTLHEKSSQEQPVITRVNASPPVK